MIADVIASEQAKIQAEQRITEYRRSQETFHFFAETIDLLAAVK